VGPAQHLAKLRQRYKPVLNGIIFIDNPTQTLNLTGDLPGRNIIVATGRTRINQFNPSTTNGGDDLCTVISYGPMTVEGKVNASLVPLDKVYTYPDARIHGPLVFGEVMTPSRLKGWVKRRQKFHSGRTTPSSAAGAFKDYYYVAVSPRIAYEKIKRN